jgi:alpha-beta hydrolase superfamily lysophospholipase
MTQIRGEPFYFAAPDRPLLGWMHAPPAHAPMRDLGLVICSPFGFEAVCAHRSLRHFANAVAERGIPALRFDYEGTGDSAGGARDPARWRAWLQSTHASIDELRRRAHVSRVCLLGTRLGATLAANAAAEREENDIAGLIAIAPVVSGKRWLRELNALEIAMRFADPPPQLAAHTNEHESVGFVITAETREALQCIDLLRMTRPPTTDVLIIDRDDLAPNREWAERLSALGASVDHPLVPGYAEMMLEPHESVVPTKLIEVVCQWIERRVDKGTARVSTPCAGRMAGPVIVAPGVEETAGYFGESGHLFGVVSAPAEPPRPKAAILLLNAGAIHHIGPSRQYVEMARRWASRGYVVLRFDQPGIGESPPFEGESENVLYAPSAVRGLAEALGFLRDTWGVDQCKALGLCSGAYHALRAVVAGLPLQEVALINPLVFFWKHGMSLAYPAYRIAEDAARYKQSVRELDKWKKFLTGKVQLRPFAQVVARRAALRANALVRDVARSVGHPLPEDLGTELEAAIDRGVALRFIFATGDPGESLLRSQGGSLVRRLLRERRLRIRRIEGPDHSFTRVWTHDLLTQALEQELDLVSPS